MAPLNHSLFLPSETETNDFGRYLAKHLRQGDCIALRGQIGAGKSALARAIIRALTSEDTDVPSPTFTLVQTYEADQAEIWHADLYRLSDTSEAVELGLLDAMEEQICLIEWPDVMGELLPNSSLEVLLTPFEDGRTVTLVGDDGWLSRLSDLTNGS